MTTRPCKGCMKGVLWAHNVDTGKPIPLDPRSPVFFLINGRAYRAKDYFVSHFATCSHADQFSRRNKEANDGTETNQR